MKFLARLVLTSLVVESALAFINPQKQRETSLKHPTSTTAFKHAPSTTTSGWIKQLTTTTSGSRAQNTHLKAAASSSSATSYDEECDVLVLGSGPAGRAIASLLASPKGGNMKVSLADTNFDKEWVPNYGVWTNEWDAILEAYDSFGIALEGGAVGGCIDREWQVTDCYFGGSFDIPMAQRTRLDRPYKRVDKNALRDALTKPGMYKVLDAKHISKAINVNMYSPAGSLVHDETGTTIQLEQSNGSMMTVRSKLIIDTTGHETKLVLRDTREPYSAPGFQIAYGCLVEVDETDSPDKTQIGPYDKEAMTLFDYRTDHFDDKGEMTMAKAEKAPTFMYAMPLKDNQIFFEETSLVARPGVSLQECKDRCATRLEYHGIKVTKVLEEEYCYIPMGGALPIKDQRVIGLGGSAVMVHPSTGYHICRCLMGATAMASAIQKEMSSEQPNLDKVAASAYNALWTPENIRQRNFAVFGGEFLMKQDVVGLRGFFDGFFKLPLPLWGGFLAGWPGLPYNENHESWLARLWYGLNFIVRIPVPVAVNMAASIVAYCISEGVPLPQSVTPLLGEPSSYEYERNTDTVGDVAVKAEARKMITQSTVTADVPVSFTSDQEESSQAEIAIPVETQEKEAAKV